ncbi:MAG TPA: ABC transporter permease subunit [Gammaproteobacteria bacterium]|nr:ABC transporter permease subunit [Gammaproteobacteria bacterium]
MRLNPLTRKALRRFMSIRRGYWSAIVLVVLLFLSMFAELLANSRALIVSYQHKLYFPSYGSIIPGRVFGLDYDYETNYRQLKELIQEQALDGWVLMPPIPYNPYENHFVKGKYPPTAPDWLQRHYLGTDVAGRDVAARLLYGFRTAMAFSLILLISNYVVGIALGCLMGYSGGIFDLLFQRLIEIWSNVPFLYVIMIIASFVVPDFWTLILIMVMFGWMSMTWYMRTSTYKEKARAYVSAARALGASTTRILFYHILPNSVYIVVTFIPFSVVSGITALTALDFLGFGLPPPTPSWGEILREGTDNLHAPWIASSVVAALVMVLTMVTFVGEAIREAFDPKKYTFYR